MEVEESSLASMMWLKENIDAESKFDADDDMMIPLATKEEGDDTTLLVVEVRVAAGALAASSEWCLASILGDGRGWCGYLLLSF